MRPSARPSERVATDIDQHAIAMHGISDSVRRNKDVSNHACLHRWAERACVRNDEAETVAVHGQPSRNKILVGGGLREGVAIGIQLNQLSCCDQLLQLHLKVAAGATVQTQLADELLKSGRTLRLECDVFEDGRVRGHGRFRLFALSLQHNPRGAASIREGCKPRQDEANSDS